MKKQHQAPTYADVQPMAGVIKLSLKINNIIAKLSHNMCQTRP